MDICYTRLVYMLPPCSARLCSVCPLPVLVCLPAALLLPVESALYQTVGRAVGLPVCLTVACAPIIARRPQLHVYPLLNVLAYCSFMHAHGTRVAVGLISTRKLWWCLPLCRFPCCQYTPSGVSRGCPLSSQPAGEEVTTAWRGQFKK